jgi:hypothetical protein
VVVGDYAMVRRLTTMAPASHDDRVAGLDFRQLFHVRQANCCVGRNRVACGCLLDCVGCSVSPRSENGPEAEADLARRHLAERFRQGTTDKKPRLPGTVRGGKHEIMSKTGREV